MSDTSNPFQSPAASIQEVKPLVSQSGLSAVIIKYLCDASPWLRFLGIMGFVGAGFCVLGGIVSLFTTAVSSAMFSDLENALAMFFPSLAPLMLIYALYFIGAGVVLFFPALFTYRFGARIRSFMLNNSEAELEQAFRNNFLLWKFNGVLMIVGMAIVPVLIIIVVVIMVASMAIW